MTKQAKELVGSDVHLVLANGEHLPARITRVRGDGLVDLEADHQGGRLVITSSPLDQSGKRPDSWHPPEAAAMDKPEPPATDK